MNLPNTNQRMIDCFSIKSNDMTFLEGKFPYQMHVGCNRAVLPKPGSFKGSSCNNGPIC